MRRRDRRSEQIVEHLAMWVAVLREGVRDRPDDRSAFMAERSADGMLFGAAVIHYQERTDRMDSTEATRWIRARVESLVADAARVGA